MLCPNDNVEMHPVTINSHYGQPIILDQCGKCGGLWFDESELFRAGQGEAAKIESLNVENLRERSALNSPLRCPRDGISLFRFEDKRFPEDIVIERCPGCRGIWLNRGEFTRYQESRLKSGRTKVNAIEEEKLDEKIQKITASYPKKTMVIGKLGEFLSTDIDINGQVSTSPAQTTAAQNTANIALGIVITILRAILRI